MVVVLKGTFFVTGIQTHTGYLKTLFGFIDVSFLPDGPRVPLASDGLI